jgi:hypothetical protein
VINLAKSDQTLLGDCGTPEFFPHFLYLIDIDKHSPFFPLNIPLRPTFPFSFTVDSRLKTNYGAVEAVHFPLSLPNVPLFYPNLANLV